MIPPAWLNDETIKLVSFDVFDTVIARRCGAPATIFRIVGEKLVQRNLLAINPPAFQTLRVQAEKRSHRHKGNREITLAEIYAELNSFWLRPQGVVEQMIACELETESENLFAIPGALALVQAVRKTGRRLVFTSDMYLPEAFLRQTLAKEGLMQKKETLYVSSRWGVSKADGGLYRVLLEQEKMRPSQVVHVGDSCVVDFEKARKLGIKAVHSDRGSLNRYETRLAEAEERSSERIPVMAGISRMVRLELDGLGEQQVAARLGASVAGPLLTQYALWVLRTARSRGVKRLYFLARDGEALMRLCEILAPVMGANEIESRYLYGSRQVWYPAALTRLDDLAADFFARAVALSADSWEKCIEYLGLNASDPMVTSLASRWSDWEPNIGAKRQLFLDVAKDPDCRLVVQKWLAGKVELASRYLREAGLVGSETCGLVDCGWSGAWTDILSDLVTAQGGAGPEVYFLGRRQAKTAGRSPTFTFLFDHQSGTGLDQIPDFFHIVVEFFLTASHGRTVGFSEQAGQLEPVLASTDLQGFTPEQWATFRTALLRFAELYSLQAS
ncbi:MAG: hypothetical protein JWQ04_2749, partial [Pedosphaera sp.]|nr:hypothetical protein [Pedosphaera sp.]